MQNIKSSLGPKQTWRPRSRRIEDGLLRDTNTELNWPMIQQLARGKASLGSLLGNTADYGSCSRLLTCLLQWQNYGSFPNLWRGPGHEAAVEVSSSSLFARGPSALRKVGGMPSGPGAPFDLICRIARSSSNGWNGWQQASSTFGDLRTSFS